MSGPTASDASMSEYWAAIKAPLRWLHPGGHVVVHEVQRLDVAVAELAGRFDPRQVARFELGPGLGRRACP